MNLRLMPIFICAFSALLQISCKKGDIGVTGSNGASVLSGGGAPAATTGADGDFYLDTTSQILYGPKNSGDWGTGVLLKGNADVTIDTFRISGEEWQYGATYYVGTSPQISTGFLSKSFVHEEAGITQDLLNTGIVQAYYTSEPDFNANNWIALPYSFLTYGGYQFNYATESSVGKMAFYFYFNKVSADPPDFQTYAIPNLRFKILMLPGKLIGEMTKRKHSAAPANAN